jgi:hypothetical protein
LLDAFEDFLSQRHFHYVSSMPWGCGCVKPQSRRTR